MGSYLQNKVQVQAAVWLVISTAANSISIEISLLMSINKSLATLLDLRLPPFAHGHLYVGLSRVRNSSNAAIFTENSSLLIGSRMGTAELGDILPITTNYIYPELLTPINITVNSV